MEVGGSEFAEEFRDYLNSEASKMAIDNVKTTLYRYGQKSGNKALLLLMKEAQIGIVIKGVYIWTVVSVHILLRRSTLIHRAAQTVKELLSK
jgi:hypothetical protein